MTLPKYPEISHSELIHTIVNAPLNRSNSCAISENGWYQTLNPSAPIADLNEVVLSIRPDENPDELFLKVADGYRRHGLPFKWCWNPLNQPAALENILKARCETSWQYSGLAIQPSRAESLMNQDLQVLEVGPQELPDYVQTTLSGWNRTRMEPASLFQSCEHQFAAQNDRTSYYFLALIEGIPVGTASFQLSHNEVAYLSGGVILPMFRRRGAYRALVQARLKKLAEMGIGLAVTQARDATSTPILRKMGWQQVFTSSIYQFSEFPF